MVPLVRIEPRTSRFGTASKQHKTRGRRNIFGSFNAECAEKLSNIADTDFVDERNIYVALAEGRIKHIQTDKYFIPYFV